MEHWITKEELAEYLNTILNHQYFKRALCRFDLKTADQVFCELTNLLTKYYISTLDKSLVNMKIIIDNYLKYRSSGKSSREFINTFLEKFIERKVADNLGIKYITLSDRIKIARFIARQNANNSFCTHCFPGSLEKIVSTNGLDISKELFNKEFSVLSNCFKSPFKTSVLNYCELSSASLSYATKGVPERVTYCIGGLNLKREENESRRDYFIRCLISNLQKEKEQGKINALDYQTMYQAGLNIINFYCQNDKTCIAILKEKENPHYEEPDYLKSVISNLKHMLNTNNYLLRNSPLKKEIDSLIERVNYLRDIEKDEKGAQLLLEEGLKRLSSLNPIIKKLIDTYLDETFADIICNSAIRNLHFGGNANGYDAPGGKIPREDISIVSFELPSETYLTSHFAFVEVEEDLNLPVPSKDYQSQLASIEKSLGIISLQLESPSKIVYIPLNLSENICIPFYKDHLTILGNIILSTDQNQINISNLNEKSLENKCILQIIKKLETLPQDQKNHIVKIYEKSSEYDPADYEKESPKFLERSALHYQARQTFHSLTPTDLHTLSSEVIAANPQITINIEDQTYTLISKDEEPQTFPLPVFMDEAYPDSTIYYSKITASNQVKPKNITEIPYELLKKRQKTV